MPAPRYQLENFMSNELDISLQRCTMTTAQTQQLSQVASPSQNQAQQNKSQNANPYYSQKRPSPLLLP